MSVGSTLVRGAEIRFREAAEKLRPFVGCFWVITADRDVRYESVLDVMDMLQQNQVRKVGLLAKPRSSR